MPQILKDTVRERIAGAALEVFAAQGYAGATMGQIAAAAGISTGNVYRYYPGKRELFDAVVSPGFVRRFRTLLRRRVRALDGVRDVRLLAAGAPYHLASEELLRFAIDHRRRVIVLLARAEGSRYETFAERTVDDLVGLAVAHFTALDPTTALDRAMRFDLVEIYRAFVRVLVRILETFDDGRSIRAAVEGYTRYHLAGLESFFQGE
jgi:AcrR family transcriptional regulator